MKKALVAGLLVLAVVAAACGGDNSIDNNRGSAGDGGSMMGGHGEGMVAGEAADASDADRQIEVEALDALEFDPDSIEVSTGEVITFVVTNQGKTDHEFVLGDESYQDQHGQDMGHGSDSMMDMGNVVKVGPGETAELTWRFDESGTILYGCHEPGHYEGGMVGTIEVG